MHHARPFTAFRTLAATCTLLVSGALLPTSPAAAQVFGPKELTEQSKACVQCHKDRSPGLYEQWGASKHFRAHVACFECHAANPGEPDAYTHYGQLISNIVSPKDCARCHAKAVEEFTASRHSHAARIIGSIDNVLAEVVEGCRSMKTEAFPAGVAPSAVSGCWQCHGSEVKVLADGKLDPATWPNSGIGRINPDGSQGTCNSCHARHTFSVEQARHPNTCGKCHLGPDHPQKEIYEESKHGINFFANLNAMNLGSNKWVPGEDYSAAPTCATCHMSATKKMAVTHDVGLRISWNNRPEISVRTDAADARMDLPGAQVPWQTRRSNMQQVCLSCHDQLWVDNFYVQYDGLIEMYNRKFGKPSKDLYTTAQPLLSPVQFANPLDWTYYELWHHEGRRARHGASMMGADFTHWLGTYEVAKRFYAEFVPELRRLLEEHRSTADAGRKKAVESLSAKLDEILGSDEHKWFIGRMDPAEAAERKKASDEFKARYEKKSQ